MALYFFGSFARRRFLEDPKLVFLVTLSGTEAPLAENNSTARRKIDNGGRIEQQKQTPAARSQPAFFDCNDIRGPNDDQASSSWLLASRSDGSGTSGSGKPA
jgi:hypothetical protein